MSENTGSGERGLAAAVAAVEDPRLFHPIGQLGLVRSLNARRRSTQITVAVPAALYRGAGGEAAASELVSRIAAAVDRAGAGAAEVQLVELTRDEESELAARLHELGLRGRSPSGAEPGPGHQHGGQHGLEGPTPRQNPFADKASPTRVLAIGSGKGGVGKSSVTVNLAIAIANAGHTVGLLDADVYGFSVPSMIGTDEPPTVLGEVLVPRWRMGCG